MSLHERFIHEIKIGNRVRKENGDIAALAHSLKTVGLLHPVVIDENDNLIAGQRRILAAQHLGWQTITTLTVDLEERLQAEHDENELRKPFTSSERVAISDALRAELGRKQGIRSDLDANASKLIGKTSDHIAKAAGFGSTETMNRAKTVVEHGTPELVQAMDSGTVSIADAATVATLPPKEQAKALKQKQSGKARTLKAASTEPIATDAVGLSIRKGVADAFQIIPKFQEAIRLARQLGRLCDEISKLPGGRELLLRSRHRTVTKDGKESTIHSLESLKNATSEIKFAMPFASVCPYCWFDHKKHGKAGCKACKGEGWVVEQSWSAAPEAYRAKVLVECKG